MVALKSSKPATVNVQNKSHFDTVREAWVRERPDLDSRNMLLALGLMRMGRMIDYNYDKKCRERFSLTGAEMRILLALRRSGKPFALRPTDLFKALLISSGAVTKQVDRLVRKQYVSRLDDPTHGGGSLVQLTRDGLRVVNRATDEILVADAVLNAPISKLSPAARDAGEQFVHFLISELESMHVMDPGEITEEQGQTIRAPRARGRHVADKRRATSRT
jgi:DNA-binding MarR family transcriptional regulator